MRVGHEQVPVDAFVHVCVESQHAVPQVTSPAAQQVPVSGSAHVPSQQVLPQPTLGEGQHRPVVGSPQTAPGLQHTAPHPAPPEGQQSPWLHSFPEPHPTPSVSLQDDVLTEGWQLSQPFAGSPVAEG